MLWVNKM